MCSHFRKKVISSVLSLLKISIQRWRLDSSLFILHLTVVISLQAKFPAKVPIAIKFKSALKTTEASTEFHLASTSKTI